MRHASSQQGQPDSTSIISALAVSFPPPSQSTTQAHITVHTAANRAASLGLNSKAARPRTHMDLDMVSLPRSQRPSFSSYIASTLAATACVAGESIPAAAAASPASSAAS